MEIKDSFGQVVQVGDYLVFATKTKYLGALGLGRVTKISEKGSVSMIAVCTYGRTLEEHIQAEQARYDGYKARHGDDPVWEHWFKANEPQGPVSYKQNLASASTCYKVPAASVDINLRQVLEKDL